MTRVRATSVAFAHFKKLVARYLLVSKAKFSLTKAATQELHKHVERIFLTVLVETARRGRPVTLQSTDVQRARYFLRVFALASRDRDMRQLAQTLEKDLPRQIAVKRLKQALLPRKKRVTRDATHQFRLFFLELLGVSVAALRDAYGGADKGRLTPGDVAAALHATPCFEEDGVTAAS